MDKLILESGSEVGGTASVNHYLRGALSGWRGRIVLRAPVYEQIAGTNVTLVLANGDQLTAVVKGVLNHSVVDLLGSDWQ